LSAAAVFAAAKKGVQKQRNFSPTMASFATLLILIVLYFKNFSSSTGFISRKKVTITELVSGVNFLLDENKDFSGICEWKEQYFQVHSSSPSPPPPSRPTILINLIK
jgi:hypothetical protein